MSKDNLKEKPRKEIVVEDKKIQFGEIKNTCFACGEKIDLDALICPFCKTKQDKRK